jgi:hypothetical protein
MVTQQIHSLRWIGVRPFHFARRSASAVKTSRMSAGTSCITPAATGSIWGLLPDRSDAFAAARDSLLRVAVDRLPLPAAPLGFCEALDFIERFEMSSDSDSRLVPECLMLASYAQRPEL